jgi:hypothetical protein
VGFVVDKVVLGQFFSEYFGFPYQFSFHQMFHTHLSSGAGTIGQLVVDLPSGLSVTATQEIKGGKKPNRIEERKHGQQEVKNEIRRGRRKDKIQRQQGEKLTGSRMEENNKFKKSGDILFSEYVANISLYGINQLVFVMETQCVFCEV